MRLIHQAGRILGDVRFSSPGRDRLQLPAEWLGLVIGLAASLQPGADAQYKHP